MEMEMPKILDHPWMQLLFSTMKWILNMPPFSTFTNTNLTGGLELCWIWKLVINECPFISRCLLLDVINGKNFHREPIKHLADIVSNHVLLFVGVFHWIHIFGYFKEYLASQCAAFRYANDTEGMKDMYAYTNLTANLAHSITSFIEKWVPTKLVKLFLINNLINKSF
jgi:hypothetical protein